jgi:hypothetical protein
MLKLPKLNTNMTLKLHSVLYPNICGGDIGLILDLHIIGLKLLNIAQRTASGSLYVLDSCTDFWYFYVTSLRLV